MDIGKSTIVILPQTNTKGAFYGPVWIQPIGILDTIVNDMRHFFVKFPPKDKAKFVFPGGHTFAHGEDIVMHKNGRRVGVILLVFDRRFCDVVADNGR